MSFRMCQCGRVGEWVGRYCPTCTEHHKKSKVAIEKSKVALEKFLREINRLLIALSILASIMIFCLTGVFWLVLFNILGIR